MHTVLEMRQRSAVAQEDQVSRLFEEFKLQLSAPRTNGELQDQRLVLNPWGAQKKTAERVIARLRDAGPLEGFDVSYQDAYLEKDKIARIVVTW